MIGRLLCALGAHRRVRVITGTEVRAVSAWSVEHRVTASHMECKRRCGWSA